MDPTACHTNRYFSHQRIWLQAPAGPGTGEERGDVYQAVTLSEFTVVGSPVR